MEIAARSFLFPLLWEFVQYICSKAWFNNAKEKLEIAAKGAFKKCLQANMIIVETGGKIRREMCKWL